MEAVAAGARAWLQLCVRVCVCVCLLRHVFVCVCHATCLHAHARLGEEVEADGGAKAHEHGLR